MVDGILKLAGAVFAAWYADKYVTEKTGKHIHEHVTDFVSRLWQRLVDKAREYLDTHPTIHNAYLNAQNIAAAYKRALNEKRDKVRVAIFGDDLITNQPKLIACESVPVDECGNLLEEAYKNPMLISA